MNFFAAIFNFLYKSIEKSDNLIKPGLRFGHANMTEGGQKNGVHFQGMIIMTNHLF